MLEMSVDSILACYSPITALALCYNKVDLKSTVRVYSRSHFLFFDYFETTAHKKTARYSLSFKARDFTQLLSQTSSPDVIQYHQLYILGL